MRILLVALLLGAGVGTAAAQSPSSNRQSASPSTTSSPTTAAPNYGTANKMQKGGRKMNTAPATGANRASRSSSTTKAANQGSATGSGNIETMHKNSTATPGAER